MKKMLPVLLLCALMLLSACGKKQAEPVGSGSAEETAETPEEAQARVEREVLAMADSVSFR